MESPQIVGLVGESVLWACTSCSPPSHFDTWGWFYGKGHQWDWLSIHANLGFLYFSQTTLLYSPYNWQSWL